MYKFTTITVFCIAVTLMFLPLSTENVDEMVNYTQPAPDHFVDPLAEVTFGEPTTVRTFFPAQSSLQWLASVDGHDHPVAGDGSSVTHPDAGQTAQGGLSCMNCHESDLNDGAFATDLVESEVGIPGKEPYKDVEVSAAFDDDYLYIRASWTSERPGITHDTFQFLDGAWERNTTEKSSNAYAADQLGEDEFFSTEDRFSVMLAPYDIAAEIKAFGIAGVDFNQAGCFVACHSSMQPDMPEAPTANEVSADPWLGDAGLGRDDIRHYILHTRGLESIDDATPDGNWKTDDIGYDQAQQIADLQAQKFLDLIQWRGGRSAAMFGTSNDAVLEYRHSGLADQNRGDNVWFNQNPAADQPDNVDDIYYDDQDHLWKDADDNPIDVTQYSWMYDESVTSFHAIPGEAITEDREIALAWTVAYPLVLLGPDRNAVPLDMDNINEGDLLPRRALRGGTGIRGAVNAFSMWNPDDDTWTLTLRRPLNKEEPCDHDDFGDYCSDLFITAADLQQGGQGVTMAIGLYDDHTQNRMHHVSFPVVMLDDPDADIIAYDNTVVSVDDYIAATPEKYSLEQNYPNPFNPTTNIEFSIQEAGHVSLQVYNSVGQKITTLVDEEMSVGTYQLTWDAQNMPSGNYFYRLEVNGHSLVKRMVLIK